MYSQTLWGTSKTRYWVGHFVSDALLKPNLPERVEKNMFYMSGVFPKVSDLHEIHQWMDNLTHLNIESCVTFRTTEETLKKSFNCLLKWPGLFFSACCELASRLLDVETDSHCWSQQERGIQDLVSNTNQPQHNTAELRKLACSCYSLQPLMFVFVLLRSCGNGLSKMELAMVTHLSYLNALQYFKVNSHNRYLWGI